MKTRLKAFACSLVLTAAAAAQSGLHAQRATEVQQYIQTTFWNRNSDLYAGRADKPDPDFVWGGGVAFSALVGASRHDKSWQPLMKKYFNGLDRYWDDKVKIPGYEPSPTAGNGNDKYYDDNAWMVLTFVEAHELTKDSRYLKRAADTLDFVLSGWDDKAGGGIWWHEGHKDGSKNTCVNAPAAFGCLEIARLNPKRAPKLIAEARRIAEWTNKTLQQPNALFADRIEVASGKIHRGQLTYNSGLMIRANLGLYQQTKEDVFLMEAKRIAKAAESLLNRETGAYRDPVKWSHLMTEADLELHEATGEAYLLERSRKNAELHYQQFKKDPPKDLLTAASIARELWLMAEYDR